MSAHQNNFIPINEALAINGQFSRGYPFLQDYNQLDFIMVTPTSYRDPNSSPAPRSGWLFYVYDKKQYTFNTILFGTATWATLDDILAYLNSVGFSPMTKYVNWKAINRRANGFSVSILVNDQKVIRRVYNPASSSVLTSNTTDLWVDFGNTETRYILTLEGDQTIAGGYYYEV